MSIELHFLVSTFRLYRHEMNGYALELIAHYHLLVYVVAISYRMTIR